MGKKRVNGKKEGRQIREKKKKWEDKAKTGKILSLCFS